MLIQFKEKMGSFPATDGRCIISEHEGTKKFFLFDCDDVSTPRPDERANSINTVLAAIKMEFGITEGFEKLFDEHCYKTTDGKCVYRVIPTINISASVESPLTLEELKSKSKAARNLADLIEEGIGSDRTGGRQQWQPDFSTRLEELIEGLQIKPSTDDAYLRLCFFNFAIEPRNLGRPVNGSLGTNRNQ